MSTILIRSLSKITPMQQGSVLTIGNFDGVHLGHQALLNAVLKEAARQQAPSLVLTFEPHPQTYFKRTTAIARLTGIREKWTLLSQYGIENLLILHFNQYFASLSASDFVHILKERLRVKTIVIGEDFRFGYQRAGNVTVLRALGQNVFSVIVVPAVMVHHKRVSSTHIRFSLQNGSFVEAERLLGHPYFLCGHVSYGNQLGRTLGYPTANIYLNDHSPPLRGVFIVSVYGLSSEALPGVASVGRRPMMQGTDLLLEVHLFDFNQTIYGRLIQVVFHHKIRDEAVFENVAALKEQMDQDVKQARSYFGC